jgi:hypothetical protein
LPKKFSIFLDLLEIRKNLLPVLIWKSFLSVDTGADVICVNGLFFSQNVGRFAELWHLAEV